MSLDGKLGRIRILNQGEPEDDVQVINFQNASLDKSNRRRVDVDVGGGAQAQGSDTEIQFNDGGNFAGAAGFTYDKNNDNVQLDDNVQLQLGSGNDRQLVFDGSQLDIQGGDVGLSNNNLVRVGQVDGVDVSNHSARHEDGGSDELEAGNLAGATGTDGQVLTTDGSAASYASRGTDVDPIEVNGSTPTITLGDGETLTLWRGTLPADTSLEVIAGAVSNSSGNAPSGLTIEARNVTDSTTTTVIDATFEQGTPLTTVNAGGDDLVLEVENDTGSTQDAQADINARVV